MSSLYSLLLKGSSSLPDHPSQFLLPTPNLHNSFSPIPPSLLHSPFLSKILVKCSIDLKNQDNYYWRGKSRPSKIDKKIQKQETFIGDKESCRGGAPPNKQMIELKLFKNRSQIFFRKHYINVQITFYQLKHIRKKRSEIENKTTEKTIYRKKLYESEKKTI